MATKILRCRGELLVHGPVQRGQQVPPLGLLRGVEAEPVRQALPVLGIKPDAGVAPEVPPDLSRHLEHDELIRPGGEPALTSELAKLAGNRDQRISRGLIAEVVERLSGRTIHGRAPLRLSRDRDVGDQVKRLR
jgi:hypothetical protein